MLCSPPVGQRAAANAVAAKTAVDASSLDWDALRLTHSLDDYDFLPFDAKWNTVAAGAARHSGADMGEGGFPPAAFNGASGIRSGYMLRLRKYRHEGTAIDLGGYDASLYVFVGVYQTLHRAQDRAQTRRRRSVPVEREVVLYLPGGECSHPAQKPARRLRAHATAPVVP